MILINRNDIRTNENSRRNQDSIFTNKLDQLKQKQIGRTRGILLHNRTSKLQIDLAVGSFHDKIKWGIF